MGSETATVSRGERATRLRRSDRTDISRTEQARLLIEGESWEDERQSSAGGKLAARRVRRAWIIGPAGDGDLDRTADPARARLRLRLWEAATAGRHARSLATGLTCAHGPALTAFEAYRSFLTSPTAAVAVNQSTPANEELASAQHGVLPLHHA